MKKLILLIIITILSFCYFGEKNISYTWSAFHSYVTDEYEHPRSVRLAYKRAREVYMNIMGNSDPCWKAFRAGCGDATHQCNVDWLAPGLMNMAISCGFFALAAGYPITQPVAIPAGALYLGLATYFLEHISRVQWLADIQTLLDGLYGISDDDALQGLIDLLLCYLSLFTYPMTVTSLPEYEHWIHFDKDYDNTLTEDHRKYRFLILKFYEGFEDPGSPHIRRYLNEKSLAVMLHCLADYHSHSNYGYAAWDALINKKSINEKIFKLGILRIVDLYVNNTGDSDLSGNPPMDGTDVSSVPSGSYGDLVIYAHSIYIPKGFSILAPGPTQLVPVISVKFGKNFLVYSPLVFK